MYNCIKKAQFTSAEDTFNVIVDSFPQKNVLT